VDGDQEIGGGFKRIAHLLVCGIVGWDKKICSNRGNELCVNGLDVILSFSKVMEHYPFYYIPLTLPSPPTTGERIKVRGSNVMVIFVPLFT
jgi:hypothetical protein